MNINDLLRVLPSREKPVLMLSPIYYHMLVLHSHVVLGA